MMLHARHYASTPCHAAALRAPCHRRRRHNTVVAAERRHAAAEAAAHSAPLFTYARPAPYISQLLPCAYAAISCCRAAPRCYAAMIIDIRHSPPCYAMLLIAAAATVIDAAAMIALMMRVAAVALPL